MTEWYARWLSRRGEAYSSLADAIEQAIRSGHLPVGAQLPTHRSLARELGVAVSTVSRAYAEATKRGLIGGTAGQRHLRALRRQLSGPAPRPRRASPA